MTGPDRWECGSFFPLMLPTGEAPFPLAEHRLYGSGRQALGALLDFGHREYGWRLVHVPAYYCPEVVESIAARLPVRRYDAGPLGPRTGPDARAGEVVVSVSYFGEAPVLPDTAAHVIVDATHDPTAAWSATVPADYVLASLRKTLPLPDGGAVWSPGGRALPPAAPAVAEHLATAGRALAAMSLKRAYLDGEDVDKARYRQLLAAAEAGLRRTTISDISDYSREALRVLPVAELRQRRIANAVRLAARLLGLVGVTVHAHTFGVILEFERAGMRDSVRQELIRRDIYPAVLWTLPPEVTPPRQLDLSRRLLYLHTDIRWSEEDMDRVATTVHELCRATAGGESGPDRSPIPRPAGAPRALT